MQGPDPTGLRDLDDGECVEAAIRKVDGKRIRYRETIDNPPSLVDMECA